MRPTRPRDSLLILLLGVLSTISPFSIDLYLPAFSEIGHQLGTVPARMALTLSSYFVGLAVGQVFYGPLLDRYGRKPPLYFGLGLFILASYGCSQSTTIEGLILFRFIQACGGCVASVAAMTLVRDFFPPEKRVKVLSLLTLVIAVSPMLAPTVGSFIVAGLGWRWVFGLLALIVAVVLVLVTFFLPDPHEPDPSIRLTPGATARTFWSVLTVPQFYTYAGAGSFCFAGLFTYVAGSPGVFMEHYGVSGKTYGAIFAFLSVGMIGSAQVNIQLLKRFTSPQIYRAAMFVQFTSAVLLLILGNIPGFPIYGFIALLFIFLGGVGTAMPNGTTLALMPFTKNAGSASAMLGILQMGIGALASTAVGIFGSGIFPVVATLATTSTVALFVYLFGSRRLPPPAPIDAETMKAMAAAAAH
ncbi:MAG: Bcr/CflA family efflux MFS transporter [Proteobacteria bacterium]|nr:MAG: Bcr/CflA family efflux MFS transporter [Pseudomonadota bacterium]